jgi:hypothetical protein
MKREKLNQWLLDENAARFLGRHVQIKIDVLALLLTGKGTLAAIARKRNVSRQAVQKHFRTACAIYFGRQPKVAGVDSRSIMNGK